MDTIKCPNDGVFDDIRPDEVAKLLTKCNECTCPVLCHIKIESVLTDDGRAFRWFKW